MLFKLKLLGEDEVVLHALVCLSDEGGELRANGCKIIEGVQANRGFATEEVSFLSFFSTSGYVGFFWGGWIEKRGECSAGYGFTEMQF